jgi:hypothetical protein
MYVLGLKMVNAFSCTEHEQGALDPWLNKLCERVKGKKRVLTLLPKCARIIGIIAVVSALT